MARIESVSSVLRQKHTAVVEFGTHTSFENRLGGPTLNHLRYGDRPSMGDIDIPIFEDLICFKLKKPDL